jgi:hypothetical protein
MVRPPGDCAGIPAGFVEPGAGFRVGSGKERGALTADRGGTAGTAARAERMAGAI